MTTQDKSVSDDNNLYQVLRFAKEERHAFLTADLLFGSAALWLPLLLGLMYQSQTSAWKEFVKLLDSGAGYTFALAYIAAGSSFLYLDREKKIVNSMREEAWPNVWPWVVLVIVLGLVFTGAHFSNLIFTKESTIVLNLLELAYFVGSVWFGMTLFCLKNIEKLPGKLEAYKNREAALAKAMAQAASGDDEY